VLSDLVAVKAADRGRTSPGRNGQVFVHEDGWYTATIPPQGKVNPPAGSSRTFVVPAGGGTNVCRAATMASTSVNPFPLPVLQARVRLLLAPGSEWDKSASGQVTVEDRSVIALGNTRINAAAFTGPPKGGTGYLTMAVVETPKGNLLLGCTGATMAQSKALTVTTFRLANGAVQ
jgi:hypothetical protein